MHHYLLLNTKTEDHDKLNLELIGPSRINRPSFVDERTGIVPPAWWRGDDWASQSGKLAMVTMRR